MNRIGLLLAGLLLIGMLAGCAAFGPIDPNDPMDPAFRQAQEEAQ